MKITNNDDIDIYNDNDNDDDNTDTYKITKMITKLYELKSQQLQYKTKGKWHYKTNSSTSGWVPLSDACAQNSCRTSKSPSNHCR